jgi:hypothetical protein
MVEYAVVETPKPCCSWRRGLAREGLLLAVLFFQSSKSGLYVLAQTHIIAVAGSTWLHTCCMTIVPIMILASRIEDGFANTNE